MKTELYLDCEWFIGGELFLVGWATDLRNYGQLYDDQLTKHRVLKLIRQADHIFIYGPDIGIIEKHFDIEIKKHHHCVNLLKVFRDTLPWWYTSMKLGDLEQSFGIERKTIEEKGNIWEVLRKWNHPEKRKTTLLYNEEDVLNMLRLKRIIFNKYGLTKHDLKNYRLEPKK